MKRTAEQWALFLEAGYSASGLHAESLAVLLRAMVAEREAWEARRADIKIGTVWALERAISARRRAEGVDGE
jgi:hypothetical protein